MEEENDLENDLFEEYGDDHFKESRNEPQAEENIANTDGNEAPTREVVPVPKRIIRNPRLKFNADRLCGERGIPVLTKHFKNVKFKGKGHEKEDLNKLLSTLEHWTHRLFPSMKFDACLRQIEKLGKKRPVQTCLVKIRRDMPILSSDFVNDEEDEREEMQNEMGIELPPEDAFDRLFGDSSDIQPSNLTSTPTSANSSGVALGTSFGGSLTEEQRQRMEYNKMLATERRKARMAAQQASKENENGRHSPSMIDPESAENTSQITAETSVVQNLDQQFESLFGEKGANESIPNDYRNNQYEYVQGDSENIHESITTEQNNSEELGLDELMDLVDNEDSSNQPEDSDRRTSEKAEAHNLDQQFDSMFDKNDENESILEDPRRNQHKSILTTEDNEDNSTLNPENNQDDSIYGDSKNNQSESTTVDSSKSLWESVNEDYERNGLESINAQSEEGHCKSLHSKENESKELGLDDLMDLVDE